MEKQHRSGKSKRFMLLLAAALFMLVLSCAAQFLLFYLNRFSYPRVTTGYEAYLLFDLALLALGLLAFRQYRVMWGVTRLMHIAIVPLLLTYSVRLYGEYTLTMFILYLFTFACTALHLCFDTGDRKKTRFHFGTACAGVLMCASLGLSLFGWFEAGSELQGYMTGLGYLSFAFAALVCNIAAKSAAYKMPKGNEQVD